MLQLLAKFLKALNSDASPTQLSVAFVFGMLMGLTPLWSLHNLFLLFFVCVVRLNLSAFLVALAVFSSVAYVLDGAFIVCGELLLRNEGLQELWSSLYQSDFWRLSHFNNTLTLGSLVVALALAIPLFVISRSIIVKYRIHIMAFIERSRFMKWLRATRFYSIYEALSDARGLIK